MIANHVIISSYRSSCVPEADGVRVIYGDVLLVGIPWGITKDTSKHSVTNHTFFLGNLQTLMFFQLHQQWRCEYTTSNKDKLRTALQYEKGKKDQTFNP